jgi:hypothetical protein
MHEDIFTHESMIEYRYQVLATYNASIAAAKIFGFIHEQGLACEKAGLFCKKERDMPNALMYFHEARQSTVLLGVGIKYESGFHSERVECYEFTIQ